MQEILDLSFETRDEFQRKPIAERIIQLLASDIDISPMVINGDWGTGKTEFCHKLIKLIHETDSTSTFKPVYVDAFSADHVDDPMLTLISAVLREFPSQKDDFIKQSMPAIKYGIKAITKAGLGYFLPKNADSLSNDFIDKSVETLLNENIDSEKNMDVLRTSLSELAKNNQIILFIDELDRCRPDFALSLLEVIKHVFNVDGVQIVLISNINQLQTSISHCYGMDYDNAKRYFDKFIGFSFGLSKISNDESNNKKLISIYHFENLLRKEDRFSGTSLRNPEVISFLSELINVSNLSLREAESLVKYFSIYLIVTEQRELSDKEYLGFSLLKIFSIFIISLYPEIDLTVEEKIDFKDLLVKSKILYIPINQDYYTPKYSDLISLIIMLELNLFDSELKKIENIQELKRMAYGLFGLGRQNINIPRHISRVANCFKLKT
jgi:Tat protein secretion system quality control protein TatD with DNase activity